MIKISDDEKNGVGVPHPGKQFCEIAERNVAQLAEWLKGEDDKTVASDAALAIRTLLSALTNTGPSLRAENERLREHAELASLVLHGFKEAAELAQAKLEEAAKVLEPFASVTRLFDHLDVSGGSVMVNLGLDDLRAARSFLANLKGAE